MIDKEILRSSEYKKIKYITDVDLSVDRFENNFLYSYANLLPKETAVEKSLLLKNILPLYLSKGSEKSFKYLFRLLFDEDVKVSYLRNNILRTSASKWVKENSVNVDVSNLFSQYEGDNVTKEFYILGNYTEEEITVKINGVTQTSGFTVYKDYQKIIFDDAPLKNKIIQIYYDNISKEIFNGRELTGITSGATAIIEKASFQLINGRLTLKLFVDRKTVNGTFSIGEKIQTNIVVDNTLVYIILTAISELKDIIVVDGGANYNVGDPVAVISPGSIRDAVATVGKVFFPIIEDINIIDGGAGFKNGGIITANGIGEPLINIKVATVSSQRTSNVFVIFSDVISDVDPANTLLSSSDFGLSVANSNLTSNIYTSFSETSYTNIGEIVAIEVNLVNYPFASDPIIDVLPTTITIPNIGYTLANTIVGLDTFGSIGKIVVVNGGSNYKIGDEVVFTKKSGCLGIGAEAVVSKIDSAGSIKNVTIVPTKISGNVSVNLSQPYEVTGVGTKFLEELKAGDKIMIEFRDAVVANISSNTVMNVTTAFTKTVTNKPIRFFGKYLVGGQGYSQDNLPLLTVSSSTGSNANIRVSSIMGAGDIIDANTTPLNGRKIGEILQIKILDSGENFITTPDFDLSNYGSGNAKAQAVLYPTYQQYEGRWTTTDSIISSTDRKLQGLNYFNNFSYLLTSPVQSFRYKSIVKNIVHPAGYIQYSKTTSSSEFVSSSNVDFESLVTTQIYYNEFVSFGIGVANASILYTENQANFGVGVNTNVLNVTTMPIGFANTYIINAPEVEIFGITVSNIV